MQRIVEQRIATVKYVFTVDEFCQALNINPADGKPLIVSVSFYDRTVTVTMSQVG